MTEPIRRRIVEILASGEHSSGLISDSIRQEFRVTRAAVSWHLAILRDNDWLIMREEFTNRFYRLNPDALNLLKLSVAGLEAIWERRIGFIEQNNPKTEPSWPIAGEYLQRLEPGVSKGLRGGGGRRGPWAPLSKKEWRPRRD